MGEMVREEILKRVKQAGVFSIIIDTTTDVSNLEQFSLVLRFINEEGQTEERLIAMKVAHDSTGLGMFNVFSDICIKYNIDWETNLCAQSYDGAASMQGKYSGVRSYVQEKNPNAIYIWCFAHVLNLVVVDTCDKCLSVRNFFGEVQSLISYMRARKRTAIFLEQQTKCYPSERPCRIKNFSTTRWTLHDRALSVISKKYLAFLKTLEELINSTDRETSSTASNLYRIMTSFQFILNLFLLENIFSHTTPLSIYLQSSSIDFIQAITMVDVCAKKLSDLRNQQSFNNLIIKTKSFVNEIGLVECELPSIRSRRRKLLAGEVVSDEIKGNW
ncbi:zinc finger MYM-type protein 1-like [Aphis gossypii]|uniref:zinc finger MYM-type protein 1-like n=1 Tax=Aphis gossypii TaxID=80765 RepID=UPI002158D5D8|nr:zinc finger MYM-type protein 1-like [Aphis gossypii]